MYNWQAEIETILLQIINQILIYHFYLQTYLIWDINRKKIERKDHELLSQLRR